MVTKRELLLRSKLLAFVAEGTSAGQAVRRALAESVADQLRRAVAASRLTAYRLAIVAGLPESTVSRLKHGVTPTLHTAERLARALGYRLVLKKGRSTQSFDPEALDGRLSTGGRERPAKG